MIREMATENFRRDGDDIGQSQLRDEGALMNAATDGAEETQS